MKLSRARQIAKEKMTQYGLTGWHFKFNNAKRQFGYCHSGFKVIVLSKPLTKINNEARITNTILHEIAHALVGCIHGHDSIWKAQAQAIGCTGDTCARETESIAVVNIERPIIGTCPICKEVAAERFRLSASLRGYFHIRCTNKLGKHEPIVWNKQGRQEKST